MVYGYVMRAKNIKRDVEREPPAVCTKTKTKSRNAKEIVCDLGQSSAARHLLTSVRL